MGVGIQCCKRNEVKESLATRHNIRVDPFASQSATIDLYLLPLDQQLYESSARLLKLSNNRETH